MADFAAWAGRKLKPDGGVLLIYTGHAGLLEVGGEIQHQAEPLVLLADCRDCILQIADVVGTEDRLQLRGQNFGGVQRTPTVDRLAHWCTFMIEVVKVTSLARFRRPGGESQRRLPQDGPCETCSPIRRGRPQPTTGCCARAA